MDNADRYLSIPQFFSELGLWATVEEMSDLADMCRTSAQASGIKIRYEQTSFGVLVTFTEATIDSCFDNMNLPCRVYD